MVSLCVRRDLFWFFFFWIRMRIISASSDFAFASINAVSPALLFGLFVLHVYWLLCLALAAFLFGIRFFIFFESSSCVRDVGSNSDGVMYSAKSCGDTLFCVLNYQHSERLTAFARSQSGRNKNQIYLTRANDFDLFFF